MFNNSRGFNKLFIYIIIIIILNDSMNFHAGGNNQYFPNKTISRPISDLIEGGR